jgi:Polysaccharide deacetylase
LNTGYSWLRGIAGVMKTHYPGFAFGLPVKRNDIPIFLYHDIERVEFARDLQFLRSNDYHTLSLDEFIQQTQGNARPGKTVLLTFDDARRSFYDTVLPLLREFNARAALFAPTYWMNGHAPTGPKGEDRFMSWPQLRECVDSGLVDVQSHAHRHALVFVTDRIVTFASPQALEHYDIYDWPARHIGDREQLGHPALGSPVYSATPLLSATGRYLENPELMQTCVDFVQRHGAEAFFAQRNWETQLNELHRAQSAKLPGRYLSAVEFRNLVSSEFELSRDEFRSRLGYEPKYLAFPWQLGSQMSMEIAKSFGISAAFGVGIDFRRAKDSRLPLRAFGRIKSDWLQMLPGKGRSNLLTIGARKLSAFSSSLPLTR